MLFALVLLVVVTCSSIPLLVCVVIPKLQVKHASILTLMLVLKLVLKLIHACALQPTFTFPSIVCTHVLHSSTCIHTLCIYIYMCSCAHTHICAHTLIQGYGIWPLFGCWFILMSGRRAILKPSHEGIIQVQATKSAG